MHVSKSAHNQKREHIRPRVIIKHFKSHCLQDETMATYQVAILTGTKPEALERFSSDSGLRKGRCASTQLLDKEKSGMRKVFNVRCKCKQTVGTIFKFVVTTVPLTSRPSFRCEIGSTAYATRECVYQETYFKSKSVS